MKRKFIKKTVSVILSVILVLTLTFGISAHEMYYITNVASVMEKEADTYYAPQAHDIADIEDMYS